MRILPLFVLLAACGGDNTAPFIGVWKNTSGSSTTTCPGMAAQTAAIPANAFSMTVSKNGNNALLLAGTDPSGGTCNYTASAVSNTTASLTPGIQCPIGAGTLTVVSGNFVVGAGVTAELSMSATEASGGTSCDATFDLQLIQ